MCEHSLFHYFWEEHVNCSTSEKEDSNQEMAWAETGELHQTTRQTCKQLVQHLVERERSLCLGGENERCPGDISSSSLVLYGVLELTRAKIYL